MEFLIYRCTADPEYFVITDKEHKDQIPEPSVPVGATWKQSVSPRQWVIHVWRLMRGSPKTSSKTRIITALNRRHSTR